MLSWLPAPLLGTITLTLLVLNTILWGIPLHLAALLKVLSRGRLRAAATRALMEVVTRWSIGNHVIVRFTQRIQWDVRGDQDIDDLRHSYLLTANHQSWADILVMMPLLNRRIPFPRFFSKRELLWVPIIGVALWGLDFPLVRRFGHEALARNPALGRLDREATRRAAERYRNEPVALLSFLEGTRFRAYKHAAQASPFRHLLKPKSGGIALAMEVMGDQLERHLDLTIVYPDGRSGFLDLLCGRIQRVVVSMHLREVPAELRGGATSDGENRYRERVRQWAWKLWQAKDAEIEAILAEPHSAAGSDAPLRDRDAAADARDDR
jgi:1-acyl-sn-glycerol-3-phosphate acyltransferase